MAFRCFAFEPTETQADDIKGLIMIPSVGNISFYMQTMINDFTADLLLAFGSLAGQIERRSVIHGPILASPLFNNQQQSINPAYSKQLYNTHNSAEPLQQNPSEATVSSILTQDTPVTSSPSSNTQSQVTGQSSSANLLQPQSNSGISTLMNVDRNRKKTPARIQKLLGDLYLLAGKLDVSIASYFAAIEGAKNNSDYQWQAAAMEALYCAQMLNLVISAGLGPSKAPDADEDTSPPKPGVRGSRSSLNVSGSLPSLQDIVFVASKSSKELLAFIIDVPDKYREIVQLYDKAFQFGTIGFYPIMQIQACLKIATLLGEIYSNKVPLQFTNGAAIPYWTMEFRIGAEIAARMGSGGASGSANVPTNVYTTSSGINSVIPSLNQQERITVQNGFGASRTDVLSWVMRAWHAGLEYLTITDQLLSISGMASVCGQICASRKHAFFLHQTAILGFQLMNRVVGSSTDTQGASARFSSGLLSGPLACLERVCHLLDIHHGIPLSTDVRRIEDRFDNAVGLEDDIWLEMFDDEQDLNGDANDLSGGSRNALYIHQRLAPPTARRGWPNLQIGVLKQLIEIAHSQADYVQTVIYVSCLLRLHHANLSQKEQLYLSDKLKQVVIESQKKMLPLGPDSKSVGYSQQLNTGSIEVMSPLSMDEFSFSSSYMKPLISAGTTLLGAPVLRQLKPVKQQMRQVPVACKREDLYASSVNTEGQPKKDVFIYNPYANKSGASQATGSASAAKGKPTSDIILVANDVLHVDVVLANPFAFDLDIQKLVLSTSGVAFKPVGIATSVPAYSRTHNVRLSGVPLESGLLHIHGCVVRMLGGCLEEEVLPVRRSLDDPKRRTKDGKRKHQDEPSRFGKKSLEFISGGGLSNKKLNGSSGDAFGDTNKKWSLALAVICEQPMLDVTGTSVGSNEALMLFEGQRASFDMAVKNIGRTPINHLQIAISESMSNETVSKSLGFLDAYEQDVENKSIRAFWFDSIVSVDITNAETSRRFSNANATDIEHNGASQMAYPSTNAVKHDQSALNLFCKVSDSKQEMLTGINLKPNETVKLSFGVFGKQNCIGANIKIAYANVDESSAEPVFYTRIVNSPVLLTVSSVLTTANVDFLLRTHSEQNPLFHGPSNVFGNRHKSFSKPMPHERSKHTQEPTALIAEDRNPDMLIPKSVVPNTQAMLTRRVSDALLPSFTDSQIKTHFVLTFDIHNTWSEPFTVVFDVYDEDGDQPSASHQTTIHPSVVKRMILPLRRIKLPKTTIEQAIPTPVWKQFVVNRGGAAASPDDESLRRAVFWYREELVGGIHRRGRIIARWFCSKDRFGVLQLRNFSITERMLHVIKVDCILFEPCVVGCDDSVAAIRPDYFQCRINEVIKLQWRITNHKGIGGMTRW